MQIGVHADGRVVVFDEGTQQLMVGSTRTTFPNLARWDAAGKISWASAPLHDWALAQAQSPAVGQNPPGLLTRYSDAYAVARAVTRLGKTVKALSYAIFGVALIMTWMMACWLLSSASSSGSAASSGAMVSVGLGSLLGPIIGIIAGPVVGFMIALPIHLLGVLVSAQGQILKATLDTAVHTSPLLSAEEVRSVLS
jgi:hypothetical protein